MDWLAALLQCKLVFGSTHPDARYLALPMMTCPSQGNIGVMLTCRKPVWKGRGEFPAVNVDHQVLPGASPRFGPLTDRVSIGDHCVTVLHPFKNQQSLICWLRFDRHYSQSLLTSVELKLTGQHDVGFLHQLPSWRPALAIVALQHIPSSRLFGRKPRLCLVVSGIAALAVKLVAQPRGRFSSRPRCASGMAGSASHDCKPGA